MINKEEFNKELYEQIKKHMKKFKTDDLMNWRNKLIELGEIDNQMLELFNAELLDRACEKIEIKDGKTK